MQGAASKSQEVQSSYSPFGSEKKVEPSKSSTYSPLGQWTPGSSKADASANLGAPSVANSKTDKTVTESPETSASTSVSGESPIASSTQSDTSKPGESSDGEQKTEEPQGTIWDALSATVRTFSGRTSNPQKPQTGAVNTAGFPVNNNVQSSYSPFGTTSNPDETLPSATPAPGVPAQAAPQNAFGVGNTVEPARNIVEPKPADQGATSGSNPVQSSYSPFAEKEKGYSPFGSTPESSGNENGENASGSWSQPVPFSPFAEWLKNEPVTSTNAPPAVAGGNSEPAQRPPENLASQNAASNPVYFSPNSPGAFSKEPLGKSYMADRNRYSKQGGTVDDIRRPNGTNTYGNIRARDFRRPDGYTDSTERYKTRAVDPTQSYSRPDPYKQGSGNAQAPAKQGLNQVPTAGPAAVPNGNGFDSGPSQQRRTVAQATQTDSFYSNPYGTTTKPNTNADQTAPKTEAAPEAVPVTVAQRGRSSFRDSRPSNNWFDDGRGKLNQDWQWNNN